MSSYQIADVRMSYLMIELPILVFRIKFLHS